MQAGCFLHFDDTESGHDVLSGAVCQDCLPPGKLHKTQSQSLVVSVLVVVTIFVQFPQNPCL